MSERLVIRLGSESWQAIHWLVWSTTENEIIASGVLSDTSELNLLKEQAGGRTIITLVPGSDVLFKQVTLPSRSGKQILTALPYMLEEQLSTDVDKLHFSILGKKSDEVSVAVVAHQKMQQWLLQLEDAGLTCDRLIPDVLALPVLEEGSAIEFENQWLVRFNEYNGICIEESLLSFMLPPQEEGEDSKQITCYSNADNLDELNVIQSTIELPMKLFAEQAVMSKQNLLQGTYKVQQAENTLLKYWKGSMIAACVAIVFVFGYHFVELQKLKQQKTALDNQIKDVYVAVFKPKTMRLNARLIKKQMKNHLRTLQGGGTDAGYLNMLDRLAPILAKTPSLKAVSIRFDMKQGSLRLQARTSDFQTFAELKNNIEQSFAVTQGALSQRENVVQGTLEIKGLR